MFGLTVNSIHLAYVASYSVLLTLIMSFSFVVVVLFIVCTFYNYDRESVTPLCNYFACFHDL